MSEEECRSFVRVFRLSVSPGSAAAYLRANLDVDICGVLPLTRVPTLVRYRTHLEGMRIEFKDRGEHQLKGISDAWHLFTVVP